MWKTVQLKDVLTYEKVNGQGSLLPYVGMENISSDTMQIVGELEIPASTSSTFKFDNTHVLYGRLRPYLKKVLVPNFEGQCSTEVFCLKPSSSLNRKFLAYWLLSPKISDKIETTSTGARMPRANMNAILEFDFLLPPLAEQQRIVAKLDAAFAEIDELIELSKKQAISASDYGYRIIKTTLEELSEQHGLSSLSNTAVIQPKKKLALAKLNEDDDVSFMGMDGLGIEEKYSQPKTIKKLSEVYKSYQYFEDNDVIFAKITPCFENGKLSIVKGLTNGVGFGSSEFVVLRTHATFQPEFLYYCLLDAVFRNNGADNMSGAVGHKRVTKEYFSNYSVPTPPLDVQQLISKKFDEVWKNTKSIVSAKHKKIEELTNLKSAILKQELQSEAA